MLASGQSWKALLLLGLVIILFYSPILFTAQFSVLTGFDSAAMDYPWFNYIASSLHDGRLPLWDPYTKSGRSFVGESATGGFSPLRLASVWLLSKDGTVSERSMNIYYALLHFLAAGLMFALVRSLGGSRFGALFAGFCFSAGGFTGRAGWFDMLESAVWLPLIFLLELKALQENDNRRRYAYALYAAVAMGMAALAGRAHIAIMDALLVIAASVFFAVRKEDGPRVFSSRRGKWLRSGVVVAIVGIVGFSVAAVQLIPSMEYAGQALRWVGPHTALPATGRIPYALVSTGYSPRALFGFLFPFVDAGEGEGFSPYFGILPFCVAVICVWKNWENRWVRFLTGVGVISFFISLGSLSYLHRLAYLFVPYLWFMREPSRFLYLMHFAGAVLAGLGVDIVLSKAGESISIAGFLKLLRWAVLGSTAVVGTLTLMRRPEVNDFIALSFLFVAGNYLLLRSIDRGYRTAGAAFLLLAITFCELGVFDWDMLNVHNVRATDVDHLDRLMSTRAAVSFLKSRPGLFRVHTAADHEPNVGDAFQLQTTGGLAATALKSYDRLLFKCGRLDLLNVRYLLRESKSPGQAIFEGGGWKVVENSPAFPRAWLVHDAVVESAQGILKHLCSRDFDAGKIALLESPIEPPLQPSATEDVEEVVIRSYDTDQIRMEARTNSRALLVLSEMYYPGWRAELDGVPVKIEKVDGALRGIAVPAGNSQVTLVYAPRSVIWGAILSLASIVSVIIFGAINFLRPDRKQSASAEPDRCV